MKRTLFGRSIRFAVLLFLLVLLAISIQAGARVARDIAHATEITPEAKAAFAAGESWPQVQKDASHSGYVSQTVSPPYVELWRRDLFPISSRIQPIIAQDLIFLPSNDRSLYALRATDGLTAWSYQTGGALVNSAAYEEGRVFFGSTDHAVYALQASDGAFLWRYETGSTVKAAPLVADGKVFIGSSDGFMYALHQVTGTLAWRYNVGAPIYDTAAYDDGRVFFGGMDSVGYALDASMGALIWSRAIPGQGLRDRWTVAGQGKVFFTPMLYGSHHAPLGAGTFMFHADADPVIYNQPWLVQRQAILNYLASNPYHQPLHVLNQSDGSVAFTPPIMYASGGSLSPHSQPVLLPGGKADVIYRRSFGEPAQWGATTNDALYTGELDLTTGDIAPIDTCVPGTGGWNNCGTFKSPIISDESAALVRSGQIIYLDIARGIAGLDTVSRTLRPFASFDTSSGWPFYDPPIMVYPGQFGWVVDYDHLKSEIDSDGNDLKRPTPIVGDTFYILHYNRLVAVKGTVRGSSAVCCHSEPRSGEESQLYTAETLRRKAAQGDISSAGASTQDIRQELEARVQEMVSAGHMAPTFYFVGLGGAPLVFYTTPAETIYTLSAAYPYLSELQKTQVRQYLATEIQTYPPHQTGHYNPVTGNFSNLVGARREYFTANPNFSFNFWPGAPVHPVVLYSVWLYSNNTGDWSYATNHYASLKSIYSNLRSTGVISSYPELSGVIGFARIARHLGYTSDYSDASAFAQGGYSRGADFNLFLSIARSRYPNASHAYSTPIFLFDRQGYHSALALHFNRDMGIFLAANSLPAVISYTERISRDVPLWWLTAPAFSHGENAYAPPEISWTNFMLHAYVLRDSTETLKSYLDAPDRKGDLLHIQKLVAILDQGAPDLSRSAKAASTLTPGTGQRITYTIALRKDGGPMTDTVHLTDTVPGGLAYATGSLTATLGTPDASGAPMLRWNGVFSDTSAITVTYAVTVMAPSAQFISNTATIDGGPAVTFKRSAVIVANGKAIYLPIVLR